MKIKSITFISIWCLWLEIAKLSVFESSTGQLQVSFQFEYLRASRMRFGTVTVTGAGFGEDFGGKTWTLNPHNTFLPIRICVDARWSAPHTKLPGELCFLPITNVVFKVSG